MKFEDLTSEDLAAIREATEAAEARTGGELVCVLVRQCDSYYGSHWKAATLGAIGGAAVAGLWQTATHGWMANSLYVLPLFTLLCAAAGFLTVVAIPIVRRLLVPTDVLDRRVDRRAALAFLVEEVFKTRDRTGVMIFVGFFEHRVRILADSGIHERVEPGAWDEIAGELTRGLRANRGREALIDTIEMCGRVLEEHGVDRRPDDVNELSDEPRVHRD